MEIDEKALTYAMEALMDAHDAHPSERFRWVRPTIKAYLKYATAHTVGQPVSGVICIRCGGSGRTDNHASGEVECGECEGTGVAYVD